MILPQVDECRIDRTKVVDYLLNPAHPDNGGKAAFFLGCGYTVEAWESLAEAIRAMAASTEVLDLIPSEWGLKFVVQGHLNAPEGPTPLVRTIWIADKGAPVPRLITAYPGK